MFQAYLVDPAFGDSGMAAVQRAISADSGLGEAWFALGDLQGLAGHPSAARLSYLRAIDLDPGQLPAMVDLSDVDVSLGRLDEALYWALRAVRQDPASPGFRSHLVAALYYLRADDAAERSMLDAERRWPDYERFPIGLARLDFVRGPDSAAWTGSDASPARPRQRGSGGGPGRVRRPDRRSGWGGAGARETADEPGGDAVRTGQGLVQGLLALPAGAGAT